MKPKPFRFIHFVLLAFGVGLGFIGLAIGSPIPIIAGLVLALVGIII